MKKTWGNKKMKEKFFYNLIHELCFEMNIKIEKLSYDWILQLSKNGKVRHITGNYFDLNSQASACIVNDKCATYEVLKSQNLSAVEHIMVLNPYIKKNSNFKQNISEIIKTEFLKNGALVIKPNNGYKGEGVTLCENIEKTEKAIRDIFETGENVALCPYYNIKTEYRTFYLNGEILLIYGKNKPFIIGKNNEKIEVSWKHNLSGGAEPVILQKGKLYSDIETLAIKAGKATNINFATIDIIQTEDDKLYVLEINSGVCANIFAQKVDNGYEIVKDIYRKALQELFK